MGQGQSISDIINIPPSQPKRTNNQTKTSTCVNPTQAAKTIYQLTDYLHIIDVTDCSDFSTDTKCIEQDENCEVCKNFAYQDWYNEHNEHNVSF